MRCFAFTTKGSMPSRLAGGFTGEAWERPACGEWSAAALTRHVAAVAAWYHEWLDSAEQGDAAPPFPGEQLAAQNELALAPLAETTGPAARELFVTRARSYPARLPAAWDLPYGYPRGTVTAGLHAAMAASEWHLHAWDLARSVRGGAQALGSGRPLSGGRRLFGEGAGRAEGPDRCSAGAGRRPAQPVGGTAPALRACARPGGLRPRLRTFGRVSSPADTPQHMGAAPRDPGALELALALHDAPAADGLAVAGRAALEAAARMVHPADRGAAVAAFLRLVTVTRTAAPGPSGRAGRPCRR